MASSLAPKYADGLLKIATKKKVFVATTKIGVTPTVADMLCKLGLAEMGPSEVYSSRSSKDSASFNFLPVIRPTALGLKWAADITKERSAS